MSNISKFSPTIDGAVIAINRKRGTDGSQLTDDEALEVMVNAANLARDVSNEVLDAHKKIMANPMQTEIANMKASRETAFRKLERVTKALDAANAQAIAEIVHLERTTLEPLTKRSIDPHDVQIASETRAWLRSLSTEERNKATGSMLKNKDDSALSAILTAPPHLAGLTANGQGVLREQYRRARFPAEMDRMDRLTKARDSLQQIGSLTVHHVTGLTDDKTIRNAEALAKQAAEAADE